MLQIGIENIFAKFQSISQGIYFDAGMVMFPLALVVALARFAVIVV